MVVEVNVKHVYRYPLETVAMAHFSKYPSEKERFVQRIEVIESAFQKGISFCRRIAICENVIPSLLRQLHILNEPSLLLEESSWLDLKQRKFTIQSRNITWAKYASLTEKSVFYPCPDNPKWTQLEQQGVVNINGIGVFGRVIEVFAEKFIDAGVKRGIQLMEDILKENFNQNSDKIPQNLC